MNKNLNSLIYSQSVLEVQYNLWNELIKECENQINSRVTQSVSRRIYDYFIILNNRFF